VKIILAILLLLPAFAWAGTNPNPPDYTISVHVRASRLVLEAGAWLEKLDVVISGKKYELLSDPGSNSLLTLGDYKAKLVKDEHRSAYESVQIYEFLFPDDKIRKFTVVGQIE
jgi:hypothetical protein